MCASFLQNKKFKNWGNYRGMHLVYLIHKPKNPAYRRPTCACARKRMHTSFATKLATMSQSPQKVSVTQELPPLASPVGSLRPDQTGPPSSVFFANLFLLDMLPLTRPGFWPSTRPMRQRQGRNYLSAPSPFHSCWLHKHTIVVETLERKAC